MKKNAFSVAEALIASAIIAIGLTAAASLVGALMAKEELNTLALRAANVQEQAVTLYRLGLPPEQILAIFPEPCVAGTPASGFFGLNFGTPQLLSVPVEGHVPFSVRTVDSTLIYPVTSPDGQTLSYGSNSVTIVVPSTVWPVP